MIFKKNNKGFSLIETIVALTIFSLLFINLISIYIQCFNNSFSLSNEYIALNFLKNEQEFVSKTEYENLTNFSFKKINNIPFYISQSVFPEQAIDGNVGFFKPIKLDLYDNNYNLFYSLYSENMTKSSGYSFLFSDNGYTKLPNGLIFQWGKTYVSALYDSSQTGQYIRIYFPQKVLNATASIQTNSSNGDAFSIYIKYLSSAEAVIVTDSVFDDGLYHSGYIYWQAIGY